MEKRRISQLLAIVVLISIVGASLSISSQLNNNENLIWPFMGLNANVIKETVNLITTSIKTKTPTVAVPAANLLRFSPGGDGENQRLDTTEIYFMSEYKDNQGNSYDHLMGGGTCNQEGGCDGDNPLDLSDCPGENYCVYNAECYFGDGSIVLDLDGVERHQAICVGNTWWDLDSGGGDGSLPTPLQGMEVCGMAGYIWTEADNLAVGEYQWNHMGYGCCGDDENEFYWEIDERCHNETEPILPPAAFKFLHITDPHIIVAGTCDPMYAGDGRTDCENFIIDYVNECSTGICQWINATTGVSLAPTIALQDIVQEANSLEHDFIIFTGDNVANEDCNENNSYTAFKEIADGLGTIWSDYYIIAANQHDNIDDPECQVYYEEVFGAGNLNWKFTKENNLFVGLSEISEGISSSRYNETFLSEALSTYQNQNKKLFLFHHIGMHCIDEHANSSVCGFRCVEDEIDAIIHGYKDNYKSIIVLSGHGHANIYEEYEGIHYFTTTATMNYPTEFRILEVGEDYINVTMSGSVNAEINAISQEIIAGAPFQVPLLTLFGEGTDREIYIDLRP